MANSTVVEIDQVAVAPNTAARLLDMGRSSIYSMMKIGTIKFKYVGGHRRITMNEIRRVAGAK